jgi:hypothetical protein
LACPVPGQAGRARAAGSCPPRPGWPDRERALAFFGLGLAAGGNLPGRVRHRHCRPRTGEVSPPGRRLRPASRGAGGGATGWHPAGTAPRPTVSLPA